MAEIVIINDEPETPAVNPAHEAEMAQLEEAVEEAQETASAALVAALVDTHVCRCDEVEAALGARLAALETAALVEAEIEAEEDLAIEAAIVEAEVEAEETAPPPPVKESKPEPTEKSEPKGRGGVSKGWFGARAR